jgi:hypothetical protein
VRRGAGALELGRDLASMLERYGGRRRGLWWRGRMHGAARSEGGECSGDFGREARVQDVLGERDAADETGPT